MTTKIIEWQHQENSTTMKACQVGNGVFFLDKKRLIEGYIPDCPLERERVLEKYRRSDFLWRPTCGWDEGTLHRLRMRLEQNLIFQELAHAVPAALCLESMRPATLPGSGPEH